MLNADSTRALEATMQPSSDRGQVESQLLAFVKQLERNYYDWRAVHLHLSQLRAQNRRDYQLRVAASEFDGLLRRFSSELFQLSNGDIVYLWHGGSRTDVDPVVLRLRYLFSDDPLANASEGVTPEHLEGLIEPGFEAPANGRFCTWFELESEYDRLCLSLEELSEALHAGDRAAAEQPLDPTRLARLETSLAAMDLSGLSRRQSICAVLPQGGPQPLFNEIYVALRELAGAALPGINLTADTWLFQRLAESLDRRLLTCLANGDLNVPPGSISLNLRLATLLSPEFLKFDHEFRRQAGPPVIIELQLIDIFAELGAYLFIREFVRDRGYLVCIDGLHHLHLPLIDRKRLGADMVKVIWSPDLLDGLNEERSEQLRAAIKRAGVDRVILCRCDTTEAIRWGQSFGLRLFQGHYIDSRLRAARPPAIAAARQALRGPA
jgi:hypothetical protein